MSSQSVVAVLGGNGSFGRVIARSLRLGLPQVRFLFLGRRRIPGVESVPFDFRRNRDLDDLAVRPDWLLDLSGPTARDDGLSLAIAARSGVPYADMAVHNGHMAACQSVLTQHPRAMALVHLGFFPGLSNLIAREAMIPDFQEGDRLLLWNDFPVYAAGGRNVARSLGDLLQGGAGHYYVSEGRRVAARMHTPMTEPSVKTSLFRWQYAELECFEHSQDSLLSFERAMHLKPALANAALLPLVALARHAILWSALRPLVEMGALAAKAWLFRGFDPAVRMEALCLREGFVLRRVRLHVPHAVRFHGRLMVACLLRMLTMKERGQPGPGLYTPEQLFALRDILPEGDFAEYSLRVESSV